MRILDKRIVCLTSALLIAAALSNSHAQPATAPDNALRVLVWNTEHGSNSYGPEGRNKVLELIKENQPDIVLWQESYKLEDDKLTLGHWVAQQLGWNAWQADSPHLCVVTPYEIIEQFKHKPWHGVGAKLRDPQGRSIIAWSIWIDWTESIRYAAYDKPGSSDAELLAFETRKSYRVPQTKDILARLQALGHLDLDIPVLLGGDWNCPSHLDWTAGTAEIFSWRRPLPLPVSKLLHESGFEDAYRTVHPDPAKEPGNTHSALMMKRDDGKYRPPERIDRLYVKNPPAAAALKPIRAYTLPRDWDEVHLPRETSVFPSDHSAVVIDLEWR
jgi:exonuclease III